MWLVYAGTAAWVAWLFGLALVGRLGVDPVATLIGWYGKGAMNLLIVGLTITPLRRFTGLSLLRFRRAVGLSAFFVLCAHLAVFALLDLQSLSRLGVEIAERPYITVGMLAFVLMIPLALTSTDRAIRKMGRNWQKLHRLTYAVILLGWVHYDWQVRGDVVEPAIYLSIIVVLLGLRLLPRQRGRVVAGQK
ncbi:ferric reductase domain protein transmembrane component domain protein [Ketogulonicigenium robustum]|uniref:Protein-methionine-sulfoxide reductase heme-binding subunit MsrQ n=1 Tax=Ketogulonicigenium robustum TaxID=92947 RepID=A0A1W6NVX1_9RHOB|nr:ferric reductase domain protein transmembrane component domain protein [Ketogulonicigenium robustum]